MVERSRWANGIFGRAGKSKAKNGREEMCDAREQGRAKKSEGHEPKSLRDTPRLSRPVASSMEKGAENILRVR